MIFVMTSCVFIHDLRNVVFSAKLALDITKDVQVID